MKPAIVICLLCAVHITGLAGGKEQAYEGEISDSQCGYNVHSRDRSHDVMIKIGSMGKTPAECTRNCIRGHGGQFVFVTSDRKNAYKIEPQNAVAEFAGQRVHINGTLTYGTIYVTSIKPLP
jgi:hypothetical protein